MAIKFFSYGPCREGNILPGFSKNIMIGFNTIEDYHNFIRWWNKHMIITKQELKIRKL